MQVISGFARGHKLKAPDTDIVRPTAARIKESLFNIIHPYLDDCAFLDLFSGSGAIGIEALSRNAEQVVFVEKNKNVAEYIRMNLQMTKLLPKSKLLICDADTALKRLAAKKYQFDIIFLDPPYKKNLVYETLVSISKLNILKENGFIIAEQASDETIPSVPNLNVFRIKEYKTTNMLFLCREGSYVE